MKNAACYLDSQIIHHPTTKGREFEFVRQGAMEVNLISFHLFIKFLIFYILLLYVEKISKRTFNIHLFFFIFLQKIFKKIFLLKMNIPC